MSYTVFVCAWKAKTHQKTYILIKTPVCVDKALNTLMTKCHCFFSEDARYLINRTAKTMQLPNKICCVNMETFCFLPNNPPPPPPSHICFCRESGTNSLYQWLPPSLKNLATPAREELFPPADLLPPQSDRGGTLRHASAQGRGVLTWGKCKSSCDFAKFEPILSLCLGNRWRPLLGFLTPAVVICLYKHPPSVLLTVHTH